MRIIITINILIILYLTTICKQITGANPVIFNVDVSKTVGENTGFWKAIGHEEYGYEGSKDKPVGHGMNSKWVRRCHWAIAMAGGYATYGDCSDGISYYYMGIPGPGKAVVQLKYLKSFFEYLPFNDMTPNDSLINQGFCLAKLQTYVFYLPQGGTAEVDLSSTNTNRLNAQWFDPRTGKWQNYPALHNGKNTLIAPTEDDWVLLVHSGRANK